MKVRKMACLPAALEAILDAAVRADGQHQGEPVALPARKDPTQGWAVPGGVAKADGWNECLDEIAKLGPLFSRPAQGEPVAYLITPPGCAAALIHAVDLTYRTEHAVPLYTHADPAEVERLRDQLAAWQALAAERLEVAAGLRTQLAETHALLDRVVDHAKFWHDHPYAEVIQVVAEDYKALSASAEPRPVIAWHVGGNGYDRICFEEPTDLPGHPCIQAVNDQSQLAQLLKRYDLRNEDVPPDERVHGIPGTSFQRLNALANEGE